MVNIQERYVCGYLCNRKLASDLKYLLDFYDEVSRISLKTKDISFMQIRLKWFIEGIENLYNNKKSGLPLLDNLATIIAKYKLLKNDFTTIIEQKSIDKDYVPFKSIDGYIQYVKNTSGVLWRMVMQMYGGDKSEQKAAYLFGASFGMIGIIRNINFDLKRNHYTLVFNKNYIFKNNTIIKQEMKKNIIQIIAISKELLAKGRCIKLKKNVIRLKLLNIFTEAYSYNIMKNINSLEIFDPNYISIKYRMLFIFNFLFKL